MSFTGRVYGSIGTKCKDCFLPLSSELSTEGILKIVLQIRHVCTSRQRCDIHPCLPYLCSLFNISVRLALLLSSSSHFTVEIISESTPSLKEMKKPLEIACKDDISKVRLYKLRCSLSLVISNLLVFAFLANYLNYNCVHYRRLIENIILN